MNEKIIERIREEFNIIGDEKITGNKALEIIDNIVNELTIPKEIEEAQKYISYCQKDLGFMGSPEYYKQKEIVECYFESIREKEREEKEKEEYFRLKKKYENL